MSRLYCGLYQIMVICRIPPSGNLPERQLFGITEPDTYESCERMLFLMGMGVPYETYRVKRAKIIPASFADSASSEMKT